MGFKMVNHVLLIPGDGTGKETVPEGVKTLDAVAGRLGLEFKYDTAIMGGDAYDRAVAGLSEPERKEIPTWDDEPKRSLGLPQETIDKMYRARDNNGAILFGAVGRPDLPKRLAELGLLHMRHLFDAVNNRPFIIDPILASQSSLLRESPISIDGMAIRSPSESLYSGESGPIPDDTNPGWYTRKPFTRSKLEQFVKEVFLEAEETGKQLLCASKCNVLTSEELLSNVFAKYVQEFGNRVKLNTCFSSTGEVIIDAAGMHLAKTPQKFNNTIVIADAMFGDYLKWIADVVTSEVASKEVRQRLKEEGLSRIITRDLCGGLYFGEKGLSEDGAFNTMAYDRKTIRNLIEVARRYGNRIGVDSIDTVVIPKIPAFDFVRTESEKYLAERGYDGKCMTGQEVVRAILTDPFSLRTAASTNMIGDLITDLAAAGMGSLGLPPSSETNSDGFGNYQPISGSAPDIAGKPLDSQNPGRGTLCNPIGQIRSAAMMLEDRGTQDGARMIYNAVNQVLRVARTKDIWEPKYQLVSTQEMGSLIADRIRVV